MFTRAIHNAAVQTGHLAADHGHGAANLEDSAANEDFRACKTCEKEQWIGGNQCSGAGGEMGWN
jgi:hypothetical protein